MEAVARADDVVRGPCVVFLPGRVICPLAGVGRRAADASNRLVVDNPATEVTIDRAAGRLTIRDDRACAEKTVLVDLVWLAEGSDGCGSAVPFTIHLEVTKTGHTYAIDLHTHEPPGMPRARVSYEPFEIVAIDGTGREVLVDHRRLASVAATLSLARRLAMAMTTTRDHLAGVKQDPATVGYRVVDRSIGVGALGRGLLLVRAKLTSLDASNARLIARRSLADMLREGTWELSLEALTERWLPELIQRDLFLFGLDGFPLLETVRHAGLRVHQTLAFRCVAGAGELRLDGATAALPESLDIARAYLEFHMLGRMIADAARG
ncbi:MAG: hypothetical protein JWP01_4253 [Myxococcales bacterium]|nr:hypothetical protein [Myxococcales bacterium]